MVRQGVNPAFAWQRNYYEHVIRNEESLYAIREYIQNNPALWSIDRYNPLWPKNATEEARPSSGRLGLSREQFEWCKKHQII